MAEILDRSTARTIIVMMFTALMPTACAPRMTVEQASSMPASPDSVYDGRVQVAPDATIPRGEIEGVVRTEDSGSPLGKATVSATSLDTRRTMQVSTDEQGRFHLSGLPLGRLVLQAHLIGYTRAIETLDLRSGVSVILGLHIGTVTLCACVVTFPVPAVTVQIRDGRRVELRRCPSRSVCETGSSSRTRHPSRCPQMPIACWS